MKKNLMLLPKIFGVNSKNFLYFGLIFTISFAGFVFPRLFLSAQTAANSGDLETACQLDAVDEKCRLVSEQECQDLLEQCKVFYEEKSKQLESDINKSKQKEKTYENQIILLKNKISKLKNQISQTNLIIKDLTLQIGDTEASIAKTSLKIEDSKEKLSNILRAVNESDNKSLLEILVAEQTFSGFFDDVMALEILNIENQKVLNDIKDLKSYLEKQKESLDGEKGDLETQNLVQGLQQKESENTKKQQESLLQKTKGEKALYEQYLKEAQENAKEIRKRIFQLAQVPESEAPTLEEAYQIAKNVENITGVRAAVVMGLLQVESAIGQNVGQCNCPACRYPTITWQKVMSKSQWDSFRSICEELGLSPDSTPVSCWVGGGTVQMGGAMGPAQFMPNTWLKSKVNGKSYKERIEDIYARSPASPWRIPDAFLAAGLYLSDFGASSQRLQDEIGSATAYLCGTKTMTSRCRSAGGEKYRQMVMNYAAEFQGYIDGGVFENGSK